MKKTAALCLALLTALSVPGGTVPRPAPSAASTPAEPAPAPAEAPQSRPLDVVLGEPERTTPLAETDQAPAGPPPLPEPEPVHITDLGVAPSVTSVQPLLQVSADHLVRDDNSAQIRAVFDAINSYRASLGLGRVQYHATVAGMAQEWSDYIASREVIEHRPSFWTDPRALSPDRGAGEVIAVRWDRSAAEMVAWWKTSPAHNAILTDPRLNVMGAGVTFTDGTWQTTPTRYAMWGVVNLFGYSRLPAGTTSSPGTSMPTPPPAPPGTGPITGSLPQPVTLCDPSVRHMPPTLDLRQASIRSAGDVVALDAGGTVWNRPSAGTGALGAPTAIASGLAGASRVFTPDWDRDGVFDLLVQWTDGRITLLPGRPAGGFGPQATLGASGWSPYGLAVGEWCATNRLPQILARDAAGGLFLYPNRGLGDLAARAAVGTTAATARLAMADADGDGLQDALLLDGGVLTFRRSGGQLALLAEAPRTLATGWGSVSTWRVVTGFEAGKTGIVAVRTDGTSFYAPLAAGSLGPARELGPALNGLRLAG
ncbi:CAP domain-containing protein [Sinomonas mesophila]|uniref:CAP domain-containing protein n=1 Tax=Sinomonas mesophila TaxID=1531955 RepID=UPI000984C975|nr:CAP domain-containing protein [Sinomonas mesophila]